MTRRYTFSVPDNDTVTQSWLAAQDNYSVSLRCLIRDKISEAGITEYFTQMPEARCKQEVSALNTGCKEIQHATASLVSQDFIQTESEPVASPKRKRGRPRKHPIPEETSVHEKSKKDISTRLNEAFASGDMSMISGILSEAAQNKGLSQLAKEIGLSSTDLKKALNPTSSLSFDLMLKICNALDLKLDVGARK